MLNGLYQALKALDPHTFQHLVVHLLKAQYPGVDIEHVEGSAGDDGLDVVSGQLDEYPTIWQCKSFANGIKDSQKQKIRDSLKQALKHFTPKRWVLCLSIDMDPSALRWFQNLAKSYAGKTLVESLPATEIIHRLLYQQTLLNRFFPAIMLDVATIREALAGSNLLTTEELADLNDQNVDSYLARMQAHDERFRYEVTFSRDRQPASGAAPGAILAMNRGSTVIQVFPKNPDELKKSPVHMNFTVRDTGVAKFLESYQTGSRQTFTAEELASFTSDLDFLIPYRPGMSLTVGPAATAETLPFRISFGEGEGVVTYDYVVLKHTRGGTEESLWESVGTLPFPMSLLVRTNDTLTNVSFALGGAGHNIKDAQKQARAILAAFKGKRIRLHNLAAGGSLPDMVLEGSIPERQLHYFEFLDAIADVADAYGITIILPEAVTEADYQALGLLHALLKGATLPAGRRAVELVKTKDSDPQTPEAFDQCAIRYTVPELPEDIILFGTKVNTGPVQYDIPKARILEPEVVNQFLRTAPIGATLNVEIEPVGPATLTRVSPPGSGTSPI